MTVMSFEKSVKGATKIKNAPPKTKYIEHILIATHAGEAGVGEVFRALQYRLRDSTWTVVFKSLITVHLMIREGAPNVTLAYLAKHRNLLGISSFTDAQTQGRNIRHYATYLAERIKSFRDSKIDWARTAELRLENLAVSKGLLRETEIVQHQLRELLKCDVMDDGLDNEITITVFRLLVMDLLVLFQVVNQGLINILRHFFEMSKPDAERAMDIYRTFTKQTDYVIQYLATARQFAHATRVEVPKIKHAPIHLGRQLEDYLKDPDFEINRRQFIAELEAKKNNKSTEGAAAAAPSSSSSAAAAKTTATRAAVAAAAAIESGGGSWAASAAPVISAKAPEPDLIDLIFDSIEQPQSPPPTAQQQHQPQPQSLYTFQPAMTGFPQQQPQQPQQQQHQQPNGFLPQQTGYPGAGPFQHPQPQLQQQGVGSNPYGPQQMPPPPLGPAYGGFGTPPPQQGWKPGALGAIPQDSVASFQPGLDGGIGMPQQQQQQARSHGMLQPQATGTNPFRQSVLPQATGLAAPGTGGQPANRLSTNPFARASPPAAQPHPPPQPQLQPFGASSSSGSPFQNSGASRPTTAPGGVGGALVSTPTGTNPFMRGFGVAGAAPGQPQPAIIPQATGTNPFRSAFGQAGGGGGWPGAQGGGGGGGGSVLDTMETIPVWPRSDQHSAQAQQQQQQPMWQQ